jgi:hypothetical protein
VEPKFQHQDDGYERDEEEESNDEEINDEGVEQENVIEAQENEEEEEDGDQPALWLRGLAGLLPLPATDHEKWVIEPSETSK